MAMRGTEDPWDPGAAFLALSRGYLKEQYFPKICRAVDGLQEADLWWRANPSCNSIGNLILHLAGNARQWVVAGIGGARDLRDRESEFRASGGKGREALLGHLEDALDEVDGVLGTLSPESLAEDRVIQGMPVSVLGAIYHVVEHFSMHTGQIIHLSKERTGRDLAFYRVRGDEVETNW